MRKIEGLKNIIANQFASAHKEYDIKDICGKYGIVPDPTEYDGQVEKLPCEMLALIERNAKKGFPHGRFWRTVPEDRRPD